MPYADFQPQTGRDFLGDSTNLMSRYDANQRANQEAQRAQSQFQVLQPVLQAKAGADIASAQASVANAARMEQFRAQAASESPGLNDEFLSALKQPDFQAQSDALAALQGKVAYMEVLPEYKGFVDTVNNARAQSHASALANLHIDAQRQIVEDQIQGRQNLAVENNTLKQQIEQMKVESAQKLKEFGAQQQTNNINLRADNALKVGEGKTVMGGAYKDVQGTINAGIAAQPQLNKIDTALSLLDDPEVRTGAGAGLQVKLERLGNALGADFKGVSKSEELNAILGQSVLAQANPFKSRMTNFDLQYLNGISSTMGNTPEGNKLILGATRQLVQRQADQAKLATELLDQGKTFPEVQRTLQKYAVDHPIGPSPQQNQLAPLNAPKAISSQEDFDALKPGETFIFNGKQGVKK